MISRAKPITWPYLRMAAPSAIGATAILWPCPMSRSAVTLRDGPASSVPARTGRLSTATLSAGCRIRQNSSNASHFMRLVSYHGRPARALGVDHQQDEHRDGHGHADIVTRRPQLFGFHGFQPYPIAALLRTMPTSSARRSPAGLSADPARVPRAPANGDACDARSATEAR